jgi:hypothetical protein
VRPYTPHRRPAQARERLICAPTPVRQALRNGYPDGVVTLAEKIMRDATVLYEFRVEDRGGLEEIVFDGSGKEVGHQSGEEAQR